MLVVDCPSSSSSSSGHSTPQLRSSSGMLQHPSTMLPTISPNFRPLERTSLDLASLHWNSAEASDCSIESLPSNGTPTPKSFMELRNEIARLEVQILHLERYLLSLYRTAFEENISTSSKTNGTHPRDKTGSTSPVVANQSNCDLEADMQQITGFSFIHDSTSPAQKWVSLDNHNLYANSKTSTMDKKNVGSGHRSLADHLGTFGIDEKHYTPDRLSEDILRCISSIYCKLASPTHTYTGSLASPTSSLSSSSIFSSKNPCDSWSPHWKGDTTGHLQHHGYKESGPHAARVEVTNICLHDHSFNYVATMLQRFRSLIRSLEKVDPRKMRREGKLAFWINVHNSLVMHAYLAYGTGNRVNSSSILKAAYNVGGHCVNANLIRSSILGIQPHHSTPWLQTLFSPGRKFKAGSAKHVYALEYPEPLVHFALCTGTYSDPMVRVFRADNIFENLKLAKEEFIQANIYTNKETKILLPKMVYLFAKDMSLSIPELLEIISGCVQVGQRKAIKQCMKVTQDRPIQWLPQSSTFRYVIHEELTRM